MRASPATGYYPYPPPQPRRRSRAPQVIGFTLLALVGIVVLSALGVAALRQVQAMRNGSSSTGTSTGTGSTPPAGNTPVAGKPTATPQPASNIIFSDPLLGTTKNWTNDQHCSPQSDGYHIIGAYICFAPTRNTSDLDLTVTTSQIFGQSNGYYGLAFRMDSLGNGYLFLIDGNGRWKLVDGNGFDILPSTSSSAIRTSFNATNTLRVVAVGTHFRFFVNGALVGETDDFTYSSGQVGITGDSGIEAVFTNFVLANPA